VLIHATDSEYFPYANTKLGSTVNRPQRMIQAFRDDKKKFLLSVGRALPERQAKSVKVVKLSADERRGAKYD
jgi:hypothetical protein